MDAKLIVTAACFAVIATSAMADVDFFIPERAPFIAVGARTSQPVGHYNFCKTLPAECSVTTSVKAKAKVTKVGWEAIRQINVDVNARIAPVTDMELYGREEVWAYPVDAGDCEDYVLLKRKELLARGFSEADLLMAVVRRYDGSGHAVLTVSTSEGDFVLDNLEQEVKLWSETPYHYLKRQSATNSGQWVEIENCPDDIPVSSIKK